MLYRVPRLFLHDGTHLRNGLQNHVQLRRRSLFVVLRRDMNGPSLRSDGAAMHRAILDLRSRTHASRLCHGDGRVVVRRWGAVVLCGQHLLWSVMLAGYQVSRLSCPNFVIVVGRRDKVLPLPGCKSEEQSHVSHNLLIG